MFNNLFGKRLRIPKNVLLTLRVRRIGGTFLHAEREEYIHRTVLLGVLRSHPPPDLPSPFGRGAGGEGFSVQADDKNENPSSNEEGFFVG
jgi:hypothetical protein